MEKQDSINNSESKPTLWQRLCDFIEHERLVLEASADSNPFALGYTVYHEGQKNLTESAEAARKKLKELGVRQKNKH